MTNTKICGTIKAQNKKTKGKKIMKRNDILNAIQELAYSQGFYGRLLRDIMELKRENEDSYEMLMQELEEQNFGSTLDMVLFFEC